MTDLKKNFNKEDANELVEMINDLKVKGLKARYRSEDYYGKKLRSIVVNIFGRELQFFEAKECFRFLVNCEALDDEEATYFRLKID